MKTEIVLEKPLDKLFLYCTKVKIKHSLQITRHMNKTIAIGRYTCGKKISEKLYLYRK